MDIHDKKERVMAQAGERREIVSKNILVASGGAWKEHGNEVARLMRPRPLGKWSERSKILSLLNRAARDSTARDSQNKCSKQR